MAKEIPDFLTVEETARVLRIRRTAAYQLVRHDLATGGSDGLRARRFGKLFRVPRAALEELAGGPLQDAVEPVPVVDIESHVEQPASQTPPLPPRPRRARNDDAQSALPFNDPPSSRPAS